MIKKLLSLNETFENKEEIILRDFLALERTKLANERTLLSYTRTSLYLLLGGLAFLELHGFGNLNRIGFISLGFSVLLLTIGIYRFYILKNALKKYYKDISK